MREENNDITWFQTVRVKVPHTGTEGERKMQFVKGVTEAQPALREPGEDWGRAAQ